MLGVPANMVVGVCGQTVRPVVQGVPQIYAPPPRYNKNAGEPFGAKVQWPQERSLRGVHKGKMPAEKK